MSLLMGALRNALPTSIACTFKPSCDVIASRVRIDVNLHTGLYVSE
jgi:hypothetical protein